MRSPSFFVCFIVTVGVAACSRSEPSNRRPMLFASSSSSASASSPSAASSAFEEARPHSVTREELCVTSGTLKPASFPGSVIKAHRSFSVDVGGMRAVVAGSAHAHVAELTFTYEGPSSTTAPLRSGQLRRQLGLKLNAKNTCNVLYVMWHIAPTTGIFVSLKRNPGMTQHSQCGANGYADLKASVRRSVPPIQPGERHHLRADINGGALRVSADHVVVWEGQLPPEALESDDGLVGVRSDNGAFHFDLQVDGVDVRASCRDTRVLQ